MVCVLERSWVPAERDGMVLNLPALRTRSSRITARWMFQEHWRRGRTDSEPHAASRVHRGEGKTWARLLGFPRGRVTAGPIHKYIWGRGARKAEPGYKRSQDRCEPEEPP